MMEVPDDALAGPAAPCEVNGQHASTRLQHVDLRAHR